jgi:glutamate--cysteine ligase
LRQADIVPPHALPALPALTKGLFYDPETRRKALDLLRDGDDTIDRAALRDLACKDALEGHGHGFHLRELAGQVLELATQGLDRLATATGKDLDAGQALEPLLSIVAGHTPPFYAQVRSRLATGHGLLALADGW